MYVTFFSLTYRIWCISVCNAAIQPPAWSIHTCKTFVFIEEPASFTAVPSSGSTGQLGVFVPAPAPSPPNYLNAESVESKWKRRQQVLENLTKGRVGYRDRVESFRQIWN